MGRWILAALVAALAVGAAVAYTYAAPKRYDAVSRVVVHPVPAGEDTLAGIDVLRDSQDAARNLDTARAYFETPGVLAAAADRLGGSASTIDAHVRVRPLAGTNVLEVVGSDSDPVRAAEVANAVRQEGIAERTARFQAQVASVLAKLSKFGSVETRRRIVDLHALQGRPDPTLETLTVATAPTSSAWPDARVTIPAGVGIGVGLAALIALLPPLLRTRPGELVVERDEEHERQLADREQALRRRADAISQRERELSAAVDEARGATADEGRLRQRVEAVTKREQEMARRAATLVPRERALDEREQALEDRERQLEDRAAAEPEPASAPEPVHVPAPPEPELVAESHKVPAPPEAELVAQSHKLPAPGPGGWTIQALDRLVAQHGDANPERVEEWRYYVHFLREHADVDGRLPASFDYLVEDTFGELFA